MQIEFSLLFYIFLFEIIALYNMLNNTQIIYKRKLANIYTPMSSFNCIPKVSFILDELTFHVKYAIVVHC